MSLKKVRIQLVDETTGELTEDVDVLTRADCVTYNDTSTVATKLQEIDTNIGNVEILLANI